ncbi:MAG: lamin tail domain-containing protein [Kofleriaceae bacterium]|nr:lamin tail domain-containing protein [Kofleriaceae bacterium]
MRSGLAALVVALACLGACGDDGGGGNGACDDTLLPGDLVITEVFADFGGGPGGSGGDQGNEWFEIHNTGSRPLDLTGLAVVHSRSDGSMARQTELAPVTIQPGQYLVLGNSADDLRHPWMDVAYGDKLGDLYNSGSGKLALRCGATEIDAATYDSVTAGESRQLDGGRPPDYTVNDTPGNWCAAAHDLTSTFTANNYGTPGGPNRDCEIIIPGMCDDGTSLRAVDAPGVGDLVITEVMTNPAAVDDTLGEWFEVKVNRDVDLNGLGIERVGDSAAPDVIEAEKCLRVSAGSLLVFARETDMLMNGGLPEATATFGFSLVSGSAGTPGDLSLMSGSTVIDAFTWTSSRSGKALQVDPDFANVSDNDDQANWCDATQTYGEGDLGTPGEPNAQCGSIAPPGTCLDGATSRPVVFPDTGDLVITEVMPNPNAVGDTAGEWFEVTATRDVDLNGIGLDRASDASNPNVVSSATCIRLEAGQRAIFARSTDATVNGGLPAVTAAFSFSLISGTTTSPGDVQVLLGSDVLDAVTWTHSTAGASRALDPDETSNLANDSEAAWCDGSVAYGSGDLGTPGAANRQCTTTVPPGTCLDDGVARAVVVPAAGDLVITEVMPNPDAVSDTTGEWFEVRVTRDVDLNGVGIDRAGDTANPTLIATPDCVRVTAGSRILFAKSGDVVANGGLPPITHTFAFSMIAGSAATPGDVQLVRDTTVLDSVTWTRSTNGTALQLDPDDAGRWCDATTPYGAGDLGTPGEENAQCGAVLPAGRCDDNGSLRDIEKPTPGTLVITEFLANPANVTGFTDAQREWFEIANVGTEPFDLNGLELARTGTTGNVITQAHCKRVPPGGFALFARSADPAVNAMLPSVDATFSFTLVDANGSIEVRDGATVLDAIQWISVTAGVARQVDPDAFTTAGNEDVDNVCVATATYGDASNTGTPRAANAQCP